MAPPIQQIVVHTTSRKVAAWIVGQTRIVFGTVTRVSVAVEGSPQYGYSDSSDTENGGDYVACTITMEYIADHAPVAATKTIGASTPKPRARFEIILKNGDKIRATACVKRNGSYEITEYGIDVEIAARRVANVIALPKRGH